MSIESITVPDLGDATEVEVIELLVSVGQNVEENDSLLVLESDKAAMEIPAPVAGTVKSIAVNLGDQVKTGSAMMTLEVAVGAEITEEVSEKEVDENTGEKKTRQYWPQHSSHTMYKNHWDADDYDEDVVKAARNMATL